MSNPEYHQEDFMFMGFPAFTYYFPVLEKYLYETHIDELCPDGDYQLQDCLAWIIGEAILLQLRYGAPDHAFGVSDFLPRMTALIEHVLTHLPQYARAPEEAARVQKAWEKARAALAVVQGEASG